MGSSCWTVASASAWFAVTSAPWVTVDLPMRPVIGDVMLRIAEHDVAASQRRPARQATSASAWRSAAMAFSLSCLLTASIFASSAERAAFRRADLSDGLRAQQRGLCGRLIGTRYGVVELIERLPRFDPASLGEEPVLDDAADLRSHLGHEIGAGAARQLARQRDRLRLQRHYADFRRWRRRRRGGRLLGACSERRGNQHTRDNAANDRNGTSAWISWYDAGERGRGLSGRFRQREDK